MHILSDNYKMETQREDRSVRNIFPQHDGYVIFTRDTPVRPNHLQVPAEPHFNHNSMPVTTHHTFQKLPPSTPPPGELLFILYNSTKTTPGWNFPSYGMLQCHMSTPAFQGAFHRLLKLLTCWFCLLEIRDYGFFILAYRGSHTVPGTLETQKTMFDCVLIKAVFITVNSRR